MEYVIKSPSHNKPRDPQIEALVKNNIIIKNHLKLYDHTLHWDINCAPEFLKYNNTTEPFDRIGDANISTYRSFGECEFLLRKVVEYFDPYDPKIWNPRKGANHNYNIDIEAEAYLSSFFRGTGSVLDSLAIEILLVSGIFPISLSYITFPRIIEEINKTGAGEGNTTEQFSVAQELKSNIVNFISGSSIEKDWCKQFLEYRHAFTHRKTIDRLCIPERRIISRHFRYSVYLKKDMLNWHEDVGDVSIQKDELEKIRATFLLQPLDEYCKMLFDKITALLETTYSLLYDIYIKRESNQFKYVTDYKKILPTETKSDFKRFKA